MNPREAFLVGRAVLRVMADSERTDEIHLTEEITGRRGFRRFMAEVAADPQSAQMLRLRPELSSSHFDYDALRAMEPHTLGNTYVRHLDENGLSADYQAAETRYVEDDEMAYWMRRFRQTHDVWHALLGLGIEGHEEVIIHAFSWGQMRLPVSAMVVFFGTLKHLVLERRWAALRYALLEAYQIGKEAAPLLPVHWETMWEEPVDQVRERYGLRVCSPDLVHG